MRSECRRHPAIAFISFSGKHFEPRTREPLYRRPKGAEGGGEGIERRLMCWSVEHFVVQ